jgi:hypothetical protein
MRRLTKRAVAMIAAAILGVVLLRGRRGSGTPQQPPTVDDLRIALAQTGVEAEVEEGTVVGGALVGWIVTVTLATPVAAFFGAFGAAVGKAAGKDAYAALRAWLGGQGARTYDSGVVIVKGSDHREVELELPVPEEALDALRELDWSQVPTGSMVWDRQARCWRPETG